MPLSPPIGNGSGMLDQHQANKALAANAADAGARWVPWLSFNHQSLK